MSETNTKPSRLLPYRSALLIVDLQYRLIQVMHDRKKLSRRASRLVQGSNILGIPQLVTEQYPRGLGETIEEVARYLVPNVLKRKHASPLTSTRSANGLRLCLRSIASSSPASRRTSACCEHAWT